ncbi:MAG TPA: BMC domain-containing protein [Thermoanaerobaculaceae bacterium]|nr:BMC domain-containing protein [Thermoanaerobaculaceae bacterium]
MKRHPAIAILEFRDIAVGMVATDALLKRSPIAFVKCGTISRGRFLTLIGGTTAAVEEAVSEGLAQGGESVLDHVLLADVHSQLYEGILGNRRAVGPGSVAVIETATVSANVRAAELALKGTPVDLIEIRLADSGLSGKGLSIFQGELHDVEAAVEIAVGFLLRAGVEATYRIISAPHDALAREVAGSTYFGSSSLLELDGEEGDV